MPMKPARRMPRLPVFTGAAALLVLSAAAVPVAAQPKSAAPPAEAVAAPKATIERLSGVWIEGPGFEVTYGKTYEVCAQRCLDNRKCAMIEYYRPEKKCNLYDTIRPRKAGGSSHVGIKRGGS